LANLLGVTPEKAIKLAVHDYLRSLFSNVTNVPEPSLSLSMGLLAGAGAGLCQVQEIAWRVFIHTNRLRSHSMCLFDLVV